MSLIFLQHTGNESTNKNYLWRPHFLINTVWVFSCAQSSAFSDFSLNFPKRVSAFGGAVTAEESIAL